MNEKQKCKCGGETELERFANFHELVCQRCGRAVEKELYIEAEEVHKSEDDEEVFE